MKIGFIGLTNAIINDGFAKSADDIIFKSGQNTGNLAFWNGFSNILPQNIIQVEWHSNAEKVKNNIDVLAIAAANFLRQDSDMSQLADLVEKIDKPVLIAGLGAESQSTNDIPELMDGTVKFLKEISKRCDFFGVRGEFSRIVCEAYGVKNAKVMSCPSIFINSDKNLGKKIENRWGDQITKFSTASASIKGNLRNSERRLFLESIKRNSSYIVQRPVELFKCILGEEVKDSDFDYINKFANYIGLSNKDFIAFLKSYGRVFTSGFSWLDYVRHCSHTINTRIHGTIFPIMAGVPSICVTHDTRTQELCDTLKLVSIPTKEFGETTLSFDDIFKEFKFDGKVFDENRKYLASEYKKLLKSFGIEAGVDLNNLA